LNRWAIPSPGMLALAGIPGEGMAQRQHRQEEKYRRF